MAGRLHQATGGNAFFVLETIRTLLASDNLAEPPQMLPLATTVEEVVRSRLAQLTAVSQQIIQAAAVLSPHLQASLIQHTAGRTELEMADALDELTARHILQETDNGHRFNHALVQTAVYQEITPWRRKTLHRRAAEIMSTIAHSNDLHHLTAIAQHYHAAAAYPEAIHAYQKPPPPPNPFTPLPKPLPIYSRQSTYCLQ
jgi:predicted ATPase